MVSSLVANPFFSALFIVEGQGIVALGHLVKVIASVGIVAAHRTHIEPTNQGLSKGRAHTRQLRYSIIGFVHQIDSIPKAILAKVHRILNNLALAINDGRALSGNTLVFIIFGTANTFLLGVGQIIIYQALWTLILSLLPTLRKK